MADPYSPPTTLDNSASPSYLDRAETPTLSGRAKHFLCFGLGCILGVHLYVDFTEGLGVSIRRTASNPANALVFFSMGVAICFAATAGWKTIRKRLIADFTPNSLTRFATGLMLVLIFVILSEALLAIMAAVLAAPRPFVGNVVPPFGLFLALIIAAVLAIEGEAFLLRFLRGTRFARGES